MPLPPARSSHGSTPTTGSPGKACQSPQTAQQQDSPLPPAARPETEEQEGTAFPQPPPLRGSCNAYRDVNKAWRTSAHSPRQGGFLEMLDLGKSVLAQRVHSQHYQDWRQDEVSSSGCFSMTSVEGKKICPFHSEKKLMLALLEY